MANINRARCYTIAINTGKPACVVEPGKLMGIILIPKGKVYSPSQVSTWQTTLVADARADSFLNRILPISPFTNVDAAGEDRQQQTSGYGVKRTTRQAVLGWNFTLWDGGKYWHSALFPLNGRDGQFDVLLVDDQNLVIGTSKYDTSGILGIGGFDLADLYVGDYILNNGSDGNSFIVGIQLINSYQFNQGFASVQLDADVFSSVLGLQTATLINRTQATGGTANHILYEVNITGVNAADLFGAALAQTGTLKVINKATGAPLTVSAITQAVQNGVPIYDATITSGTGITVIVSYVPVSTLAGLTTPVVGIEGTSFEITIP